MEGSKLVPLGGHPMFKGQWKNIFAWWPMEGSKLNGPWKESNA
jgi:hypothetical protein